MPIERLRPTFTEDCLSQIRAAVPEAFADDQINWETLRAVLGERFATAVRRNCDARFSCAS
jgi:hypothetical protein